MGTRHLTYIHYQGRFHVAQYGQWDDFPSGQGVTILKFLTDPANIERLKEGLKYIIVPEYDAEGQLSTDPSLFDESHASLSCNTGAGILEIIASATTERPVPIVNDFDFINDPIFCQWAYVVDLDKELVEVFYNHCKNYVGRFDGQGDDKLGLLKAFPFDRLKDESVDEFFYDCQAPGSHKPHGNCEGGSN